MTIHIRNASLSDIPTIADIYRDSVLNGTASYELTPPDLAGNDGSFRRHHGKGYPYIVAEDENGQMLGYAYASAFRTRPAYRWLVEDSIYLAPSAQAADRQLLLKELVVRAARLLAFGDGGCHRWRKSGFGRPPLGPRFSAWSAP